MCISFFAVRRKAPISTVTGHFMKIAYIEPKEFIIPHMNTSMYKICELQWAVFFTFSNISQPNFALLLILKCSFSLWYWFPFSSLQFKINPQLKSSFFLHIVTFFVVSRARYSIGAHHVNIVVFNVVFSAFSFDCTKILRRAKRSKIWRTV